MFADTQPIVRRECKLCDPTPASVVTKEADNSLWALCPEQWLGNQHILHGHNLRICLHWAAHKNKNITVKTRDILSVAIGWTLHWKHKEKRHCRLNRQMPMGQEAGRRPSLEQCFRDECSPIAEPNRLHFGSNVQCTWISNHVCFWAGAGNCRSPTQTSRSLSTHWTVSFLNVTPRATFIAPSKSS